MILVGEGVEITKTIIPHQERPSLEFLNRKTKWVKFN